MKIFKRNVLTTIILVGVVFGLGSCSGSRGLASVNTDAQGVAIHGFDAVAYFAVENAVKGNKGHEFTWNGAKWLFSSEENMNKFKSSPEAYAPQYGGYCAYAVSEGYTANGDPAAWKIVDGKLYLNYSPKVKEMWEKEQLERIKDGDQNWQTFKTTKPEYKG